MQASTALILPLTLLDCLCCCQLPCKLPHIAKNNVEKLRQPMDAARGGAVLQKTRKGPGHDPVTTPS